MILQALNEYYERKATDPESGIAPEGFEYKEIPFVMVLDESGALVNIEDTRGVVNKKLRARSFLVPQGEKRSSGVKAYLLWDNVEYVLGVVSKGKPERVKLQHKAFIERIESLNLKDDAGVGAVLAFLRNSSARSLEGSDYAKEIVESGPFMTFRIDTDTDLVCQRKAVINRLRQSADSVGEPGFCLISGQNDVCTKLQPAIKGVRGTNTTGGNIVSFNLSAFNSFGKEQGANAPMGQKASFAYTTALNYLLGKDSLQKLQVGDATTVFWSDRQNHLEDSFGDLFDEPNKDNPDRLTNKVRALLKAVDSGSRPPEDNETTFFILGLSPNTARISIRFWHVGTVAEFSQRIALHFHDLEIDHREFAKDSMSLRGFLKAIAPLNELDRVPPNVAGEWMRSILAGSPYPETLYQLALRKSKSHRKEKTSRLTHELDVEYPCAAIIKACLNRKNRYQTQYEKEMTVSLDKDNTNPGYRTGRLFAVLEKIQEEASPGINATIRDRYYSSASGTPASVFPILLRMKVHHLGKLEKRGEVYFEKLLGEIMGEVAAAGFPAQLSLQDQGRFAIGYYHQRQDFFTKSDKSKSSTTDQGE